MTRVTAGDESAWREYRSARIVVGGELARRSYLVYLEGPESMREPVERLRDAFDRLGDGLDRAVRLQDPAAVSAAVLESREALSRETRRFIDRAQAVLADPEGGG